MEVDPDFQPMMPRAVTLAQVKRAWTRYHKPGNRLSIVLVAEKYGIKGPTLQSAFKAIRRCGGIDEYIKKLEK